MYLTKIIVNKQIEIEQLKQVNTYALFEKKQFFTRKCLPLTIALNAGNDINIIAEHKRQSPSKGIINASVNVTDVVTGYANNGAAAVSILTDAQFFGGNITDIQTTRNLVNTPILQKDFILHEIQLLQAKAAGADIILLIAACLTPTQVKQLASVAKLLGMQVLLEIHNETELNHINTHIDVVGINNRNLQTFEVDIANSINLKTLLGNTYPIIAESGLNNIAAIHQLDVRGFKGYLIGEHFMKQPNPAIALQHLLSTYKATY